MSTPYGDGGGLIPGPIGQPFYEIDCTVAGPVVDTPTDAITGFVGTGAHTATSISAAPAGAVNWGWTVPGPVANSPAVALAGGVYTGPLIENFCPNPSFEVSLAGYGALTGTTITQTGTNAAYGRRSMQVVTDGLASGEGVIGPLVTYVTETIEGSLSVHLSGETGTVTVAGYSNPGGVLLGSATALLTPAWNRVVLEDLDLYGGDEVYLVIRTPFAQDLTFLVDAVQYEESSPASSYIDGDQPGCAWLGTAGLSASILNAGAFTTLIGGVDTEGSLHTILPGEAFDTTLIGGITFGGEVLTTSASPVAAFDDFALFELTDPDPAMTYASWNNASQHSGETDYTQSYALFHPPLDYPNSTGANTWNRAQYMAAGFEFVSVAAGVAQNIIRASVENLPLDGATDAAPVPRTYDPPRALHTIVHPSRLNYCPNPSFEVDLTGWAVVGTATLSRETAGLDIAGLGTPHRMKSIAAAAGDGAVISIPDLIVGDTYTVSCYAKPGTGMTDVLSCPDGTATGLGSGVLSDRWTTGGWTRIWFTFLANASTVSLAVTSGIGTSYVDDVLIEAGSLIGTYFDGSYPSADYGWETGGTAELTRSYYYANLAVSQQTVASILQNHTPLGVIALAPVYWKPYSQ